MMIDLLRLSVSPHPKFSFCSTITHHFHAFDFNHQLPKRRRFDLRSRSFRYLTLSNSLHIKPELQQSQFQVSQRPNDSPILLDVTGMMCGACVSRVKSLLSADERVDSVVVNMLTETAAVRLKSEVLESGISVDVADSLARRLTDCGFEAKRRVSGLGVAENVEKWREMVKNKEELLVKSRNRVVFAWTLVALCCGSHASHILHPLGIHALHGIKK